MRLGSGGQKHLVREMKASKYNVSLREGSESHFLVNTLTTAVLRVAESRPSPVHAASLEAEAPFDLPVDDETRQLLLSNGFLVPVEFDETKWLERLHRTARTGSQALAVGITVTLGCNLRCTYCYQDHENIHLSRKTEDSIIRFVSKNLEGRSLLRVFWFGGEPLLRVKAIQKVSGRLLDLAAAFGVDYDGAITSNGVLLTEATSRVLVDAGVTDIQVTLDGPPGIHDQRRLTSAGGSTFHTILSNLIDVSEMFSRVIVRINIDKRNCDHAGELLELLYPIRDSVVLAVRPATSPESPQSQEAWCLSPSAFWALQGQLSAAAHALGFGVLRGYAVPGTSFCSGYQQNSITIDPHGDVHLCPVCVGRRSRRYGILRDDGTVKVEDSLQQRWADWSPFDDLECSACKALPICMGGCLWYVGRDKSQSLRCFAKHGLVWGVVNDALLRRGIRAPERRDRR